MDNAEEPAAPENNALDIKEKDASAQEAQLWLRMEPELTRAVLAKTEEELLGGLAALMRNKVETEKANRRLAYTLAEIEEPKQEWKRCGSRFALPERSCLYDLPTWSESERAWPNRGRSSRRRGPGCRPGLKKWPLKSWPLFRLSATN
jgi:hypothetical protein